MGDGHIEITLFFLTSNLMKLLNLQEIYVIFSNFMYFFSTQALFKLVMSKHLHEIFDIFSNLMYFSIFHAQL